jgi:hypothetical protein
VFCTIKYNTPTQKTHTRQVYSAEVILTTYDTDPVMKDLVDNNQVYILMTANPDGFNHMWNEDDSWRKNRRPNEDGTTTFTHPTPLSLPAVTAFTAIAVSTITTTT